MLAIGLAQLHDLTLAEDDEVGHLPHLVAQRLQMRPGDRRKVATLQVHAAHLENTGPSW